MDATVLGNWDAGGAKGGTGELKDQGCIDNWRLVAGVRGYRWSYGTGTTGDQEVLGSGGTDRSVFAFTHWIEPWANPAALAKTVF